MWPRVVINIYNKLNKMNNICLFDSQEYGCLNNVPTTYLVNYSKKLLLFNFVKHGNIKLQPSCNTS